MRRVPAWVLKGGVVCLTVLATVGAADYVGGHVKSHDAPLRPPLQPVTGVQAPGVQTTQAQPVTEKYVS